jgi:beta-mannosidase
VELTSISKQFGCRNVELVRDKDSSLPDSGESFYFKINGVSVYCKGANMIPMHVFTTKETIQEYKTIIDAAVSANMNCLRIVRLSIESFPFPMTNWPT